MTERGNLHIVMLSGGVGGARLARGLAAVLAPDLMTVVVNVGDDDRVYGVDLSPDLDTVCYTLAGIEGTAGWGVAGDTFAVMDHLSALGVDTTFRLGDRDLALNLKRTAALRSGRRLSAVTADLTSRLGVGPTVLPATDSPLRTRVRTASGTWLPFQEYFVARGHRDAVSALDFEGAGDAVPAPGVMAAIAAADAVVIGPSNPPLSIWPILAVPGVRDALGSVPVFGVSPLFGGKALKGPAAQILDSLGFPPGTAGVVAAYEGLLAGIIVDTGDAADATDAALAGLRVGVTDTRIADRDDAARLGAWLLDWLAA